MKEVWKPIKGYEKLYLISNNGRVKSLRKNIIRKTNTDGSGYLKVELYNKSFKTLKIHRLVAEAFVPNPLNKNEVNHKDGNILNNNYQNLEWVTSKENSIHRIYVLKKNYLNPCKPILCVELNKKFPSIGEASRFINCKSSSISEVLNNRNRKSGGYHWITQ